jgi:hypothetical protein
MCQSTNVSGEFCVMPVGNDDSENGETDGDLSVCHELIYVAFLLEWDSVASEWFSCFVPGGCLPFEHNKALL